MDGIIPLQDILEELYNVGFLIDSDPRFRCLIEYINKLPQRRDSEINLKNFKELASLPCGELVLKALRGDVTIPDFTSFRETLLKIFKQVEHIEDGENAQYIPQLAEVDPNQFGIAICTCDG